MQTQTVSRHHDGERADGEHRIDSGLHKFHAGHVPTFADVMPSTSKATDFLLVRGLNGDMDLTDVAELIERTTVAAKAFMRGDMRTYFSLIRQEDDFVLMGPFGGEPRRGPDNSPESIEALERFFRNGEASLEVVQTYASGDMVVLVAIERQHGEVGGLPDQDWSLRVTMVFRNDGTGWRQVHRHADPLVHGIGLEQLAALAGNRGAGSGGAAS